jgi:glucokinase
MLLAGDIGGTKTDLAGFSHEAGPHLPLVQAEMHSADYPSLQTLVTEFLQKVKMPVERACFDVAGPVVDGRVKTTNLPWVMDEAELARDLNLRSVHLLNDLEAVARAVPILRDKRLSKCTDGTYPDSRHCWSRGLGRSCGLRAREARGKIMVSTTSLSALGYENRLERPVIRLWNDIHHFSTSVNRQPEATGCHQPR